MVVSADKNRDIERKSSAITMSDMEIFVFPELMYSLVLAELMSPRIWLWKQDPWFEGLERMKPYRRITRLKQYIMDHYAFNLDLETWGLTTKEREMARFRDFVNEETLLQSNALFGYEGDKYYFDIDIRRHFGLEKYDGNVLPYWKTETVEAMDAFRFKPGYSTGAGECVSLAVLYAVALFIVAGIPLEDIYLMATPLHSQNFVDMDDGILTNNRRLVTKTMWFNGTALSGQARRALENERVSMVAHSTGYIHTLYEKATMDRNAYGKFAERLKSYLKTGLTREILLNFIRHHRDLRKCFQLRWKLSGVDHYIGLERVMTYEEGSPFSISDSTRDRLMGEIDSEEFSSRPMNNRVMLNDLEDFIAGGSIDLDNPADFARLRGGFSSDCLNSEIVAGALKRFCHVEPQLPDVNTKKFVPYGKNLRIDSEMLREEIIEYLADMRKSNEMADLAFYAFRDLSRTEPGPFLKAAMERNPISIEATKTLSPDKILEMIRSMPSESIYDGPGRVAQPDEVWNFGRGDGFEKVLLLANILRAGNTDSEARVEISSGKVTLLFGNKSYEFDSAKEITGNWDIL